MEEILLFAGTSEGRRIAEYLEADGRRTLVCVATEYGGEAIGAGALRTVRIGPMDERQMEELMRQGGFRLVIDATHPFAREATDNIRLASRAAGIPCLRCVRPCGDGSRAGEEGYVVRAPSLKQAVAWLGQREGAVLAATGSKELGAYCALADYQSRVYARVLPTEQAIKACRRLGLGGDHIIAVQGPFSVQMNLAMLNEYNCRYLVTKDSGQSGGLSEKLEAARLANCTAVLIERPVTEEGMTVEEITGSYERYMKSGSRGGEQ